MRLLILATITILIQSCSIPHSSDNYDLIIQNVKLFDGDSVYENATVLIQANTISEILFRATEFTGENVIEGAGKTLIPGLINAHIHADTTEQLREAARAGVLTVLDLFNFTAAAQSLKAESFEMNDMAYYYWAGPTVTVPGGHGSQYAPVPVIRNIEDIPRFIDDRVNEGADFIKLIIETGYFKNNPRPTLSDEMLQVALSYTGEKDLISVVHISLQSDAIKAAKYGAKGLAHIWAKDTIGISDSDITTLVDSDVFIIPTMLTYKKQEEVFRKRGREDLHINVAQLKIDLFNLHKRGVPILTGTDPSNLGINFGTDLYAELFLLVESGLSPIEALKSASSIPSNEFRLGERGYIKKGFPADFVLINGNPIEEIKDIINISNIWKRGQEITPYDRFNGSLGE